jgi:hypothetical protein
MDFVSRPAEERITASTYMVGSLFILGVAFILLAVISAFKFRIALYLVVFATTGVIISIGAMVGALSIEKRKEATRKNRLSSVLADASSNYFEKFTNINVENLSAYYYTVKNHANKSFFASLGAGLVGFVLIAIGIYFTVNGAQHAPSVAILSGVSGVVTEFISAVFFYLYSQTVRQMKEYHDSLLAVQNVLLSFKLVGDTSDPSDKARMIGVMLQYLVGSRVRCSDHGATDNRRRSEERQTNSETQTSGEA